MKASSLLLLFCLSAAAENLPILGLAHAAFQVSDLEKATGFYQGVLGYQPVGTLPKADGTGVGLIFFKVNDDQYIEVSPGLAPDQNRRMTHISFQTDDIEKLHKILAERGLNPTEIKFGRDKNRNFGIKDPEGNRLEITQYMPGSMHSNARGKAEGPGRISTHMMHAGIMVTDVDAAMKFYRDTLGFKEFWRGGATDGQLSWINMRLPGTREDYVELMISAPDPTRERLGSMQHICLEVPEIQAAYKKVKEQGTAPKIGRNKKWQVNLFDPDGSRTELMEPREAKQ
jgi:catechol 2,3-dioxygenase-like lactoylglutathione lyase family enzyme